jgi:hypothetical protein
LYPDSTGFHNNPSLHDALKKLFCRITSLYFDILSKNTLKLFYSDKGTIPITAIGSSGFTSGYSSYYYSVRTGKMRKHFLKTSIAIDTDQQIITGFIILKNRVHDSQHILILLKKYHKTRKSECYVMDRGYDSEKMHRLIRETLKANPVIPARSWKNTENIRDKYRKEITDTFTRVRYRKRYLVKTRFAVLNESSVLT